MEQPTDTTAHEPAAAGDQSLNTQKNEFGGNTSNTLRKFLELDKQKLLPTPANIQKYIDVISNNDVYKEIIDEFNLHKRVEIVRHDLSGHSLDDSCKLCGYCKCQRRMLKYNQFYIKLTIVTDNDHLDVGDILNAGYTYRYAHAKISPMRILIFSKFDLTIWYRSITFLISREKIYDLLKTYRCRI